MGVAGAWQHEGVGGACPTEEDLAPTPRGVMAPIITLKDRGFPLTRPRSTKGRVSRPWVPRPQDTGGRGLMGEGQGEGSVVMEASGGKVTGPEGVASCSEGEGGASLLLGKEVS